MVTAVGWIVAATALGVVGGAAATAARLAERDAWPLHELAQRHATVTLRLTVSDDPRPVSSAFGRQSTIVVTARVVWLAEQDSPRQRSKARLLVLASDPGWRVLLPGQQVTASGRLALSRGGDLTAAVLSTTGGPAFVGTPPFLQRAAGALRAGLQRACLPLPAEPGGLLPGLVIGDTSHLDQSLGDDFRATGLTHLVAVSGANCAIVGGLVLLLARWCRTGPYVAAGLSAAALVGFVILARPSASVLRAAAMGGLTVVGLASGRPRAAVPALGAAVAVLVVVVDPALAVDAGFALSVLATAGLLLLAPGWSRALRDRGVPPGLAEALAVPAAAQAACAPVIAALSATVSLTAVPANLLAGPAVAPATVLGVVAAVLSPVWPLGAAFLAWLASWPARWLVAIAHGGASVPAGVVPWPGGIVGGLLLAGVTVALLLAARRPVVRRLAMVVTVSAVLGAVPVRLFAGGWPPDGWIAVVCDVGQGDAVVLAAGPHTAVVIDTGPEPSATDRCLQRLGIDVVALLVITHFHADHIGGLAGVLHGRVIDRIVVPPYGQPSVGRESVLDAAAERHLVPDTATVGTKYVARQLVLKVLGPRTELRGTRSDPNNNSVVLRAESRGHSVLLTGDAEVEEQHELLHSSDVKAEVLKLAHHGSAFQDVDFLAAVGPSAALVSVGAGNDYGHPNLALLSRLHRNGVAVLRTDQDGDLAVTLRSGRLAVVARGRDPGRRR